MRATQAYNTKRRVEEKHFPIKTDRKTKIMKQLHFERKFGFEIKIALQKLDSKRFSGLIV
jgi:hypothetical protein